MQVLASMVIEVVRSILVITRNKIPTSLLNNSNFSSKHNTLKHSLLQLEETGSKTLQDLKSKTLVQQCYKAVTLHEGKLPKLITPIISKVTL
jgi:hypothetical protein